MKNEGQAARASLNEATDADGPLIGGAAKMDDAQMFDALFREAISAIGAGDNHRRCAVAEESG